LFLEDFLDNKSSFTFISSVSEFEEAPESQQQLRWWQVSVSELCLTLACPQVLVSVILL